MQNPFGLPAQESLTGQVDTVERQRRNEVQDRMFSILLGLDALIFQLTKPEYHRYSQHARALQKAAEKVESAFKAI